MDGHTISISKEKIRRLLERASKDEPNYICLPEHANLFTQTKLLLEIYTKDEINKMFYGFCGEQENNKEARKNELDHLLSQSEKKLARNNWQEQLACQYEIVALDGMISALRAHKGKLM